MEGVIEETTKMQADVSLRLRAARNKILRGAIVGQGDMDMWKIISIIKESGYDQEISLEFEGMEDCIAGTYYGLEMAKYIWEKV